VYASVFLSYCECVCLYFPIYHVSLTIHNINHYVLYYHYSASIPVNKVMENSRSIESLDGYQKRKVTKKPLFQRLLERAQADEERAMRKKVGLIFLFRFFSIVSFFIKVHYIMLYIFWYLNFLSFILCGLHFFCPL
jgi:hypothetical protein